MPEIKISLNDLTPKFILPLSVCVWTIYCVYWSATIFQTTHCTKIFAIIVKISALLTVKKLENLDVYLVIIDTKTVFANSLLLS